MNDVINQGGIKMPKLIIRATVRDRYLGTWHIPCGWQVAWPHPSEPRWVVLPVGIAQIARFFRTLIHNIKLSIWIYINHKDFEAIKKIWRE